MEFEAASVEAFIQQLAVGCVQHGHLFYVAGSVPERKEPRALDAKLVAKYGLDLSKWSRARRKKLGQASVRYLRFGRFFVLIATRGRHRFFAEEPAIRDVRREPIRFGGYSISYRRGTDQRWHASVRIARPDYLVLKAYFEERAFQRSCDELVHDFQRLPFEPYAPVRRQFLSLLRIVNRKRKAAGFEPVPLMALRLRRKIARVFYESAGEGARESV